MSASLATNTAIGFKTETTRFIIKSESNHNQMEVPQSQLLATHQQPDFATPFDNIMSKTTIRAQDDTCLRNSGCNVGELLKLTDLKLNDEASSASRATSINNKSYNCKTHRNTVDNSIAYHQQLTDDSRMLVGFDNERQPTNTPHCTSRVMEQEQIGHTPATQFIGSTSSVQNLNNFNNEISTSFSQQQHHQRFNNFAYPQHNYPNFIDHHHHHHQQQQFSCNEVFSNSDILKTITTEASLIRNNSEQPGENNQQNLEYLELDSARAGSKGSVVSATVAVGPDQSELSFSSIIATDNQYKTSRNYTALDSVNQYPPLLDCAPADLSDVIRGEYPSQEHNQYQDDIVRNSYKHQHHHLHQEHEHILLLQQKDSGHASSVSCVDSAGSVSFNEASQRLITGLAHQPSYNTYQTQEHTGQYCDKIENPRHRDYGQYSTSCSHDHNQHQYQQQQQSQHYNQLSELLVEPDLKVCEWEGCENTFLDMQEFVKHLEDKHVNQAPREKNRYFCLWSNCKRNEQEFNARYKLLIHMRVHSGEKPYPCNNENCKKSFSRLENLKIHVRSHTGEKPYKCNFSNCSKSFTNSSDRIKHHKTHRDPKPYSCNYSSCTKRYTDPSSLRKHLRTHKARNTGFLNEISPPSSTNPTIQVSLTAEFDPNYLLNSPQRSASYRSATTNPIDSNGHFIDPNQSYVHIHSNSSVSASEVSGNQYNSTYYESNYNNNQQRQQQTMIETSYNQDTSLQQQQHMQFSRSWCAGYTTRTSNEVSGSDLIPTSYQGPDNVQQVNQSSQCLTNSLENRWSSNQNVENCDSSKSGRASTRFRPAKLAGQHENLMRSLPHTSSISKNSSLMPNFDQLVIQENWSARLDRNSNTQALSRIEQVEERSLGDVSINKQQQFLSREF